jgi:hypothetical protein
MNDFLKMDIFFSVTTAIVIVLGVFGVVAFYYIIRILKYITQMARIASEEAGEIRNDIADIRAEVREKGVHIKHIIQFFTSALNAPVQQSRKTRSKTKTNSKKT